jgi:hypothetical protein
MPALPLDEAGKYVAAAYVTFTVLILVYVTIIGAKIERIGRELQELNEALEEEAGREPGRSREAGGRELTSERGAGGPAEVPQ